MSQQDKAGDGSQTNIRGNADGPVLSGKFHGPVIINAPSLSLHIPLQKPPRTHHFVGREKELATLLDSLKPGYAVTLCGPGGIGKTALVSEILWRLAPDNSPPSQFPDGVIFHTFYHQPQASLALEALARAFGEDPRPSPIDTARRALAGRKALLILDGAESADNLDVILEVAVSCGIIITSRRHRDAPADWSDLSPLPQDQAIQLLRAWGHNYAADEVSANRICEFLGGLPLAIVLAGKYMSQCHQQAEDYLAWLEATPLAALDLGERQHQSIPVLMKRSLDQLSELSRASFRVAGILAMSPFGPELIATALNIPRHEADRHLGELVDYGLIIRPDTFYHVAHTLAYTYARKDLVTEHDMLLRLAQYYCNLLKEQGGPGLPGKIIIDTNRAHILALQSACLDASEWDAVCKITLMFDNYLDLQGYSTERVKVAKAGLQAALAIGDYNNEGAFLNLLGLACADLGDMHLAIDYYNQALAVAHKIRNRQLECYVLGNMGNANIHFGDYHNALKLFKRFLHIAHKIGDKYGEGNACGNLGRVYQHLGKLKKADESYRKALEIHLGRGDLRGASKALSSLGRIYSQTGKFQQGIQMHEKRLEISCYLRDIKGEYTALCDLGNIYLKLGKPHIALDFYNKSLKISQEIKDLVGEETVLGNIGTIYLSIGRGFL